LIRVSFVLGFDLEKIFSESAVHFRLAKNCAFSGYSYFGILEVQKDFQFGILLGV